MIRIILALFLSASFASAQPNIVFIMADDLGCHELGCYGQKLIRTPHIDSLAADGIRFTRFYAGNAVCAPSRCSLLTGKHPGHATIRNNQEVKPEGQFPIRADDLTIADYLKKNGYTCGAIGKWGLGMFDSTGCPLKHGFDLFYGYNCQRHAHSHYPKYLYRNAERVEFPGNDLKSGDSWSHGLFEKEALAFLDANAKKPFFLFLPFTVPHVAVQAPEDAVAEYRGKLGDDPAYDGKKGYQPHPSPHAGYAAMVTRMDRTVGRIVAKLKELDIDRNTLVFFTSDNGPTHNVGGADSTFFKSAGGLRGLKGSLYEGGIRIPMIAVWPGTIKPGTCAVPLALWDVMPTLLQAVNAETPKGIDGISFLDALHGRKQQEHDVLYWEFSGYGGQQALISGNWKAVRQQLNSGKIRTQLFDLSKDPGESTDVADSHREIVNTLEAAMKREHVPSKDFPLKSID